MDNEDEVVCIGDLHKKNITGFKAWNLRRFALIGNNMVYYKKGVKRGEWDITGCTVRKMTAEECNSTAAQFAFGIEGPKKQYLFSATSAKNRDLWIEMIAKQIDEFKNPIRKFLKRGEVIVGSGMIKRKNMFGKIPSHVIVTNFPRVLILDPATNLLKDQLNWVRGQSSFTKLDKNKFKLTVNHKDINFEDCEAGTDSAFWEQIFHQLDTSVELYAVTKKKSGSSGGGIVKIGLAGSSSSDSSSSGGANNTTGKDHKQLKAEQNLIFLEEGASSIMQLLITLNTKIDALDATLTQSIQHSDEWSINPEATQLYQDRLVKRTQLQMLKENIDMIAMNLEKLSVQSKKSPLTTSFDRVAIRNVIEEAGTLLALLNADDEDEDDDDKDSTMQFGDEVQHMDAQIAQMEEDNLATEEMIANVEFLSLYSDDSSVLKLNEKFDSLIVDEALDMKITSDNFNPDDISIRPPLWKEIRTKRLLIKEYVLKLEGCMEDSIIENRKNAVATEEVLMVQEISTYGRLLTLPSLTVKGGVEKAAMYITVDNFDPHSPDLRPPAWRPIRLRRVMVKEDFSGNSSSGGPPVSEADLVRTRPRRVVEEEKVMIQEVLKNQQILSFGLPSENPERASVFLACENIGSGSGNERVSVIRERANTMRDRAYTIRDKETIGGGRARVASAVPVYRGRASSTLAPITDFHISPDSFDPENEDIRPDGWMDVRMKRVMDKEELERLEGTDEESIILSRRKKLQREEELMVQEVVKYGNVVGFVKPIRIVNSSELMAAAANDNSDPPLPSAAILSVAGSAKNASSSGGEEVSEEEAEFNTTLMKRVLILEQKDREKGVDEEIIYSKRKQREADERVLMKAEIQKHGKILGVKEKEYGRRRAATILQDVTMIEINEENFLLSDPTKRPNQWAEVRLKRVMLKEHMDRIAGGVEQSIIELRPLRETEEELAMVTEVVCFGRLLGVGETCKPSDQIASTLDVTPEVAAHYDVKDDKAKKRPAGWTDIHSQRVALRELEERLRLKLRGGSVSGESVTAHKAIREEEEEKAMIAEACKGPVSLLGTRSTGGSSNEVEGVTKGVASVTLSSATPRTAAATQAVSEAEDYERRRAELRRVERIEVTAKDLDGTQGDRKPAGWAEIKLRRVYLKEWQDRRDGLDEDEILGKRYERELEVEEEMTQAITVFGRIRLFENRIQTRTHGTAPLFPKDKDVKHKTASASGGASAYKPDTVSRAGSGHHTSAASSQLSASAMSMELLVGRLEQLAEDSGEADS